MQNEEICKVSVIVPVYRVEKYIDRCIGSLLRQTLPEIEIVCICEKEDSSYKKLLAYAKEDARLSVIEKKNTGVSSARNVGLRAAKGTYIAFVDADDWIERHALQLLYAIAEQNAAQITVYGIWPVAEPDSSQRGIFDCTPVRNVLYHNSGMKALFYEHGSRPYIGNKFYNREFLIQNCFLFDESIDIGEDHLLQFQVFGKAETICFIKEKLYHYDMKRSNSATNACQQQKAEEKNFHLLEIIMQHKNENYKGMYNQEYTAWILQDYAWLVNQKEVVYSQSRKNKILSVQKFFKELSAEQYISELPIEYQYLYERFMSMRFGRYIRIPYWEYDTYMTEQATKFCQMLQVPKGLIDRLRRVHEMIVFHEIRHWAVIIPVRIVQHYKLYRCRKRLIWKRINSTKSLL
ncbi:MAG: glycosyltransferase [Lachnospiraceae bacterium]